METIRNRFFCFFLDKIFFLFWLSPGLKRRGGGGGGGGGECSFRLLGTTDLLISLPNLR